MAKERILQVIGKMDRGGAEAMIMNLLRNVDREKIVFDFLVHTNEEGVFDKEIKELGGRIYHMPKFNGINVFSYFDCCKKFFAKHPEYHIVHGHIGSCAALYLLAAKQSGCITIAHSHDAVPHDTLKRRAFYAFSFPTRFISDYFLGCSTEAGKTRFGKMVLKSKRYLNFKNGIDTEKFKFDKLGRTEIRNEFGIPSDAIVIGAIGRFTAQKNPKKIFEIFKSAIKGDNVYCLWVGTGELENYYREENESSRIIITGVRGDVSKLMSAMDTMIMPSFYEGLPVVSVEAQTTGLPCLLSECITKESQVTDLISWMSLDESSDIWSKKAISIAENESDRESYLQVVRECGYDIKDTSKWLTDFYLNLGDKWIQRH